MAAAGVDDLAVEDHVRRSLGHGALQCLPQSRGPLGQYVDDLGEVAVGSGLRQAEAGAEGRTSALPRNQASPNRA